MTPSGLRPAGRITSRDARLLRLIAEHGVLTSAQITAALFPQGTKARSRIALLRDAGLIETFRPAIPRNQPAHCVVTNKGLRILAESGSAGQRPRLVPGDAALAAALRPDLNHLLGVNGFFCNLMARAREVPDRCLEEWLSQQSTAAHFPARIRPGAFGSWREGEAWCEFFLEYDLGTEPLHRLASKIEDYTPIIDAADVCSPVLVWVLTPARERHLHQLLGQSGLLGRAAPVPVATAVGDPATADVAGGVWKATFHPARLALADLGSAAAGFCGVPQRRHVL